MKHDYFEFSMMNSIFYLSDYLCLLIIYLLSLTCNLTKIQRIEIGQINLLTRGNAGTMTPLVALSRGFCGP